MKIQYKPASLNNFHNCNAIKLVISGEKAPGAVYGGEVYRISKHQARRIKAHFCGVTGCQCPAGAVEQLDEYATQFGIRTKWCFYLGKQRS